MSRSFTIRFFLLLLIGLIFCVGVFATHGQSLSVEYGATGVQRLSFQGAMLEDLGASPSDAFHIWHMKSTDLHGNVITAGQYGWGESNNGRSWDSFKHVWHYPFVWGSIQVAFIQNQDRLDMQVTTVNKADSGIIFDGATIYPFVLHLPQLPAGFSDPSYSQYAFNTIEPGVTVANYGIAQVVAIAPSAKRPLYSGFLPAGSGTSYYPIMSGTTPDGLAVFQPHYDRPVRPGETDTYTVSLRFASASADPRKLAVDAYRNWSATYPARLQWQDRRVIGTVFLASSPSGNMNQPAGFPNNPRRYFNDSNSNDFDVTTTSGLVAFQTRLLLQAQANVANLKRLNAQGAITWDIEGEQYPQTTSYVCSPDQIAIVAPEMESTVTDSSSPYRGMKLDDAYFKTMTDAGFRVGVCIRPQHFTLNADGTAGQVYLSESSTSAEMIAKMRFAHDRWGVTLFYIDSTVNSNGSVLDAELFQKAAAALPDSLLIPEESTPLHYAYTAPFKSFIDLGALGTDASVYNYYPKAFSAILVNDVDAGKLQAAEDQLELQVKHGDILMVHADYWQANNDTVVAIYASAKRARSTEQSIGTAP